MESAPNPQKAILAYVENCCIKCFSFHVPGILKALAIALITMNINLLRLSENFCEAESLTRLVSQLNMMMFLFLYGDLQFRKNSGEPSIALFIIHSIFDFIERDRIDVKDGVLIKLVGYDTFLL